MRTTWQKPDATDPDDTNPDVPGPVPDDEDNDGTPDA